MHPVRAFPGGRGNSLQVGGPRFHAARADIGGNFRDYRVHR
jgi:hypothetical protein